MANYQICDICGNLSERTGNNKMCPVCEESYFKVRNFAEKNPRATILEISKETRVSVSLILDFVNKGYLSS